MHLFAENTFDNYWFASGTPTFLIQLSKQMQIDITEFERRRVPTIVFESYDIDTINIFALLMQTGYLTITDIVKDQSGVEYTLRYPNKEVREAFLIYLFESFSAHEKRSATY